MKKIKLFNRTNRTINHAPTRPQFRRQQRRNPINTNFRRLRRCNPRRLATPESPSLREVLTSSDVIRTPATQKDLSLTQDLNHTHTESLLPLVSVDETCAETLVGTDNKDSDLDSLLLHGRTADISAQLCVGALDVNAMAVSSTTHDRSTRSDAMDKRSPLELNEAHPNATNSPLSRSQPSLASSWAKPLIFKPPVTPPDPSTPQGYDPAIVGNQLAALWPSLNDEILNKQPKTDGTLRFPWAARLGPQSRNLYRAATPTYRLDGMPELSIPSKVLRLRPKNKDEYVIGKFHRGVWHIDDCLLFVLPWTPEGSFKFPEISTLLVWVNLKNISDCCYSRLGISHVASGLGEPILTHKPRLDPTNMGEAKVVVEMKLDKDFPKLIALDDKQGSVYLVKVDYTWIPSTCERCGSLGHKAKKRLLSSMPQENSNLSATSIGINADIHVVDIGLILQQQDNVASSPLTFQQKDATAQANTYQIFQTRLQASQIVLPNLLKTSSPLVDSKSAPTTTPFMESSPSNIINNEVHKTSVVDPLTTIPQGSAFESPSCFNVLGNVDEIDNEPLSSIGLTRGGRETKPPIKYQDLEWKTVRGRGKHGHRGHGSTR
ncbi:hypothetical protein N665_0060s0032 [Sinapis alba]|nr:hypothetical protein N665_0060s0032 [Sinapis alba]